MNLITVMATLIVVVLLIAIVMVLVHYEVGLDEIWFKIRVFFAHMLDGIFNVSEVFEKWWKRKS